MDKITVDSEITLIPYFPNESVTLTWYQDKDLCKQVDNIDCIYSMERLQAMYSFLSTHGLCYYIEYLGTLAGDISLQDNAEISIVVCKDFQNRHIGRRCVQAMLRIAKDKGYPAVKAHIYSFNSQSRKMFLHAGFSQISDEWFEHRL